MTLDEIIETISLSEPQDWNEITCWGAGSGPSYRQRFEFYKLYEPGSKNILHVEEHRHVASLKENLNITIAWGLEAHKDFNAAWISDFSNTQASSSLLDIFFAGSLVFRLEYVNVDGGSCYLPILETVYDDRTFQQSGYTVPRREAAVVALINELGGASISRFKEYVGRLKVTITDKRWP